MGFLPSSASSTPPRRSSEPAACCRSCGSSLVQPQGWKELPGGDVVVHLRCPECMSSSSESLGQREVKELDDALVRGRHALVADYELLVRHNMRELLHNFGRALELNLIGAEDFRSPPRVRRV
jgi:hypothetical protein